MRTRLSIPAVVAMCLLASINPIPTSAATADRPVYADSLDSSWENWSWDTTLNFTNSTPVHGGSASVAATYTAGWGGIYLNTGDPVTGGQLDRVRFWIHGGTSGGQPILFMTYNTAHVSGTGVSVTPTKNAWTLVEITSTTLGKPDSVQGLVWQNNSAAAQPKFYLDDITLVVSTAPPVTPTLAVNATSGRHAISPYIYGMNFTDESLAQELRLPVRRRGGNSTTRYNWQNDTSNHASDWYFENIPEDNSTPGQLPNGSDSDHFVEQDRRTGSKSIITVPLIGWTPKSRAYAGGFSVTKYGAQQSVDPWRTDYGNGVATNGTPLTGNDPLDTSIAIGPQFVKDWIAHLVGRYGTAAQGGVLFYNLDNEPMLWNSTHRDVHPQPVSYDELLARTTSYARAVKDADPGAKTLGPVLWGWTAYFYSALDAAGSGAWWNNPVDRNAHGGTPFVDWYLQQMRVCEQTSGTRLLDYLDLHYYPQASGVSLSGAGSAGTQQLRLRSTRALWDSTYVDESWIGEPVRLIPRMHDWVNTNYPGTKLAVTEYNWGALDDINGALTQADVLGIFGREALDLATLWGPPTSTQPGAYAFRMYRNYDGAGASFGDTSIQATASDQEKLAIYAAQRTSDQALTLMIINKTTADFTTTVSLSSFAPGSKATVYRYSAANLAAVVRQADQSVSAGGLAATFPASSATLIVIPRATGVAEWEQY